jgi:hypothetical protein
MAVTERPECERGYRKAGQMFGKDYADYLRNHDAELIAKGIAPCPWPQSLQGNDGELRAMDDHTLYGYTLAQHEYKVTVPAMNRAPSDEPTLIIAISAHGGGTVGQSYAHNGWDYAVYADGTEITNGDDLASGAPRTHAQMARELAGFLPTRGCDTDATAIIATAADRLALFAEDR